MWPSPSKRAFYRERIAFARILNKDFLKMKSTRHATEQIIEKLRQADATLRNSLAEHLVLRFKKLDLGAQLFFGRTGKKE